MGWLDAYRGLAVLVMIEAHVFNSFAQPRYFEWPEFSLLSFINGLVAPSFLWIAGFLAGLSALKIQGLSDLLRRLKRCAEVYFIGAILHAPWWLWLDGDFSPKSWHLFFQQNILQCMGLSLASIYLLGFALRGLGPNVLQWSYPILMVLVVFSTESIAAHFKTNPWLSLWVSESNGSLFPYAPWVAFSLAGASCATLLWGKPWHLTALLGLAMIGMGLYFEPEVFRKAHPSFFVERLGFVVVLGVMMEKLSNWKPRLMLNGVGRSSLGYYVWHLATLYFIPFAGIVLIQKFGERLNLWQVGVLYVAVLCFCVVVVTVQERGVLIAKRWFGTKKG